MYCNWFGFYLLYVGIVGGYVWNMFNLFKDFASAQMYFFPVFVVIFYVFYFWLLPRFLFKKRFAKFFLLSIAIILGATVLNVGIVVLLDRGMLGVWEASISSALLLLLSALLSCLLKGSLAWVRSVSERKALQKKHLESQTALLLLKAQMNPHFLFNSLNNIDVLIQENPGVASEYLKKLSDILRYVLYETREDETDLSRELDQIENYIELQRIRTDNPHYVRFQVTGDIQNRKIAPMIFLPFIENAFKHSHNKTMENAIDIEFELLPNQIKMVCKNYFEASPKEIVKNEGLGIETIKQRLNLLYQGRHQLLVDSSGSWFSVHLIIGQTDVS